jgi:anti-sigma B factor antagonist
MPEHRSIAGPSFEVRVDEDGKTVTLSFAGELDLASAATTKENLARVLEDGAAQVVVDLTELTFIDSTGIALLVLAKRGDGDGRLRFVPSESAAVCRVLALTGVDEALGFLDGSANGGDPV